MQTWSLSLLVWVVVQVTGAAPIVAKVAKELGILTVAVVTKPFSFEGKKRMQFAELGIKDLSQYVDSMIIIPNQQIQKVLPKNATLLMLLLLRMTYYVTLLWASPI